MKAYQFWILTVCSVIIGILMIKQIFLSRQLNQQQRQMAECQQVIQEGSSFDNAWKQLAGSMYQASAHDPSMTTLLQKEGIKVHQQTPPASHAETPATPAPAPASVPASASAPAPAAP
jgi:hypothetical protein